MIDTAAKRRSISGVGGVPLIPGVTPDAAHGLAWRQQSGWGYSGIPVSVIGVTGRAAFLALPADGSFLALPGCTIMLAEPTTIGSYLATVGDRDFLAQPGDRGFLSEDA